MMNSYSQYGQPYYAQYQQVYWQSSMPPAPISYEQSPMIYYPPQQNQYAMAQNQYYYPPQVVPQSSKPTVSCKSSQNVAKLKRKNTDYYPKNWKKDLVPDNSLGSKSPSIPQNYGGASFGQISAPADHLESALASSSRDKKFVSDTNIRKFTIDEQPSFNFSRCDFPVKSPEEEKLEQRLCEQFQSNPNFIDCEDQTDQPFDGFATSDYSETHLFGQFHAQDDEFYEEGVSSSGPILNHLFQAEKPEV